MNAEKPKSQPDSADAKQLDRHAETRDMSKKEVLDSTKGNLSQLKRDMNRMTLGARGEGDRISLRQQKFEERVEKELQKVQEPVLKQLDEMFASYNGTEDYAKFLTRVRELVDKSKQDVTKLQQSILYSVRCLAGYDRKITAEDYAYFDSILDNISEMYSKDVKLVDILSNIQKENLTSADWDAICNNIKSKSFKRTPTSAMDEIKLSTSAFFVQMMTPDQRTQLLIEFSKRHGKDHATELANQMVNSSLITLKQHEKAMTEITGAEYIRTEEDEKHIRQQRVQAEMIAKEIGNKLKSPLAINAAERLFNRKSLGSLLITGIGVMGMVTNYMNGLNTGKGIGKWFNGLTNPYFIFSAAVAGGGYHALTGAMHPGKGVGAFDKFIGKPRELDNLFGTGDISQKQDTQMKILAETCADHKSIEDYLLSKETKGFDDIWSFYQKKDFDQRKLKSNLLTEDQKKQKGKKGLYDEFLEYVEKERGNERGAVRIREAERLYGKAKVERMIFNVTVASHTLGINTTDGFYGQTTQQNLKYHDIFLYRQGVGPKPKPAVK